MEKQLKIPVSKTFKGTDSKYHVVYDADDAKGYVWGVSFSLEEYKTLVVRFATRGVPEEQPKHFKHRGMGRFMEGEVQMQGVYFNKVEIPLTDTPATLEQLTHLTSELEVPTIIAEWVERQFKKAGLKMDNVDLESVIADLFKTSEEVKPVFNIPLDLIG